MRTSRSVGAALAAALLAVVLSACAGLPTSGPVNAGQPITGDDADSSLIYIPDAPAKDATPQQIVEGFIAAGSGPQGVWATAKLYLAPEFQDEWNPREGVIVYAPGERDLEQVAEDDFTVTVTPTATIDSDGEMSSAETGAIPLEYKLAQQSDGQWRITQAPQGIVLDRARFSSVFRSYALQFFDPTWTYLVPDQRWFPQQYASTSIAAALVDGGPSPWLEPSVATAFTDATRLSTLSVPVQAGVAVVSLQEGARALDEVVLDRMQTQLFASLRGAGVVEVDMFVEEQPLAASVLTSRSTIVDARPLVRTQDAFGFLSGTNVDPIPDLSPAVLAGNATDIEVNADRTVAAVRTAEGSVARVDADGQVLLDARAGRVAPSIDPLGYIWSVAQSAPSQVTAYAADGTAVDVPGAWPGASQVIDQRVSRDGTRIAAIVRDGGGYALWVQGVLRDRDGVPTALGDRKVVARLPSAGAALTWVDAATVTLLTAQDGEPNLWTQSIGGFPTLQRAPHDGTATAGGTQSGGVRLRDAAGDLYGQRNANWQRLASGILVLAIQQGTPR